MASSWILSIGSAPSPPWANFWRKDGQFEAVEVAQGPTLTEV